MSTSQALAAPKWPSLWLRAYCVLNILYFPLCHLLEPNASNPYYIRIGGGWQTSVIFAPSVLLIGIVIAAVFGASKPSRRQLLVAIAWVVVIAGINFVACVAMAVTYAW